MSKLFSYLHDKGPILYWVGMSIPCGILAGVILSGWHYIIGYSVIGGFVGGFFGIALAFLLIGYLGDKL